MQSVPEGVVDASFYLVHLHADLNADVSSLPLTSVVPAVFQTGREGFKSGAATEHHWG